MRFLFLYLSSLPCMFLFMEFRFFLIMLKELIHRSSHREVFITLLVLRVKLF